jgi:hypothetical protein
MVKIEALPPRLRKKGLRERLLNRRCKKRDAGYL